jgi:hypothetical protein
MQKEKEFPLATIYCDESGNTGPNLLSKSEPFFVYAWVLLTKEQEEQITKEISELLIKENLPLSTELHSVKMWQSSRGCHRMDEVLRTVHNAGATIFITFSEKLFEACIFIIETYMDDLQNPKVTEQYRKIEFKRLLANVIRSSISQDQLKLFLQACNADDVQTLRSFGLTLARMLALHPDSRVSAAAQIIEAGIGNIYRFGERTENTPSNMHLTTSHIPLFSLPLLYIDQKLDQFQLKAKLIRDQDFQFGETLDLTYKIMLKKELGIKNVVSCEEGLSSLVKGLQIADLAAGITTRVLKAKYTNHRLKSYQWSIWKSLLGSLLFGLWSYQLTSDECEVKLAYLWKDIPDESWYKASQVSNADDPSKCSCGQIIPSRHLRDFYLHVLECHPDAHVMGFPCSFCKQLIPFGLSACHDVLEHNINPPFHGAVYGDLQRDLEVLQKVRRSKIKIVLPKQ